MLKPSLIFIMNPFDRTHSLHTIPSSQGIEAASSPIPMSYGYKLQYYWYSMLCIRSLMSNQPLLGFHLFVAGFWIAYMYGKKSIPFHIKSYFEFKKLILPALKLIYHPNSSFIPFLCHHHAFPKRSFPFIDLFGLLISLYIPIYNYHQATCLRSQGEYDLQASSLRGQDKTLELTHFGYLWHAILCAVWLAKVD